MNLRVSKREKIILYKYMIGNILYMYVSIVHA